MGIFEDAVNGTKGQQGQTLLKMCCAQQPPATLVCSGHTTAAEKLMNVATLPHEIAGALACAADLC